MNAGKLLITLAADVASLQSDLNKGSRAVERFSRDVSKQIDSVRSAFTTIVGLAGAGSLTAFLKSAVDTADQLGKVAARSGTTVEAFSAINYAAGLADVSTESLGAAMAKLARNADSAARGNQEAQAAFSRLGISVQDAAGRVRGTDQLLGDVAKVLGQMPDGATKTALAMSVLGKSGAELIPLLNDNADGFAAITREAQAAGVVISGEASKAAQDFNDNITRLHASLSGFAIGIVGDFLPGINKFVEALKEAWSTSDGFLKSFKALGGAIASRAYGTDQERLGELMQRSLGIDARLKELQAPSGFGPVITKSTQKLIDDLKRERASVEAEIKGLMAIMPPEQTGAAAAKPAPAPRLAPVVDLAPSVVAERNKEAAQKVLEIWKENEKAQQELAKETDDVRAFLADQQRDRARLEEQAQRSFFDEQQRTIEALRTPQQVYVDEVKRLYSLDLPQDTLNRGIDRAAASLQDSLKGLKDNNTAARELGFTFSSAFEQAVVGGKGLQDVLKGILSDIATIFLRKAITEPLAAGFSSAFSGLFGGGSAGASSGGGLTTGFAESFSTTFGSMFGGGRASGGPVNAGATYVVGENGPELLHMGQAGLISSSTGQSGTQVVVNNYSGQKASSRETVDSRGRRRVEVVIGEAVAGELMRGGSAANLAMRAAFGAQPALVGR